ncbi:MAG: hypothetical protein R6U50_04900 [Desulfobacterales bacterium]
MTKDDMTDQKTTTRPRTALDHIWNPTPTDVNVARIVLWICIILTLVLPQVVEDLSNNQTWHFISIGSIFLAFAIRIVMQVRLSSRRD